MNRTLSMPWEAGQTGPDAPGSAMPPRRIRRRGASAMGILGDRALKRVTLPRMVQGCSGRSASWLACGAPAGAGSVSHRKPRPAVCRGLRTVPPPSRAGRISGVLNGGTSEIRKKPNRTKWCLEIWRTGRDLNPRYAFTYTRVPGVRLKPLGHLSVTASVFVKAKRPVGRDI